MSVYIVCDRCKCAAEIDILMKKRVQIVLKSFQPAFRSLDCLEEKTLDETTMMGIGCPVCKKYSNVDVAYDEGLEEILLNTAIPWGFRLMWDNIEQNTTAKEEEGTNGKIPLISRQR